MQFKNLLLLIGTALMPSISLAAPSLSLYGGVSLAWDSMFKDRTESYIDYEGVSRSLSHNKSLLSRKMNGYGFVGLLIPFNQIPLFIAPEIQIGQGNIDSKLDVTINQFDPITNTTIPRRPNATFSRSFTTNFAVRIGSDFNTSYQVYALGGIDISRFNYKYSWEKIDFNEVKIEGFETLNYTKWKIAPLLGAATEKNITKNLNIGLDFDLALYNSIKIYRANTAGQYYFLTNINNISTTYEDIILNLTTLYVNPFFYYKTPLAS